MTGSRVRDRAAHQGPLLMVGSAFAWAAGLVATKWVLNQTRATPTAVLTVQLAGSLLVLVAAAAVARTPVRGGLSKGWVGLLEPGLSYYLALAGLALTSAVNASILGTLEPVLVPILALLLFRERPAPRLAVIVVAATIGSLLVSASGTTAGSDWRGDLLILASVAAAALYVVLASTQVVDLSPLAAAIGQQLWALALVLSFLLATFVVTGRTGWTEPQVTDLLLAAGSGILNYALPFWLYLVALTKMPVSRAAAYLTLIPLFGVALAAVVLGEDVSPLHLAGGVLVVGSLFWDALGHSGPPGRSEQRRRTSTTDKSPSA
ncbi:DMT family transporter [Kribbella speibonae]|uniref:DMT family transporter n=1 Tax=Kribbella speibonae TaxID=1572660 RepID=A0ABY2ACW7_9ACTN|nr:DMT family transporter [Kribbella speibonae]TCC27336.1 DMT family transporter [Kribbella speibonae]